MSALRNRRTIIIVVVVVALLAVSVGVLLRQSSLNNNSALTASGTVETTQVSIAPEVAGKVQAVNVQEGDSVKAGDVLLTLDGTVLKAQQNVAAAGLDSAKAAAETAQTALNTAQAQYQITLENALAQAQGARIQDWFTPSQFDQPNWYFTRSEQIQAAQAQVDTADANLNAAQSNLDKVVSDINNAKFIDAETRLANAQVNYLVAKAVMNRADATGSGIAPDQIQLPSDLNLPPYVPAYRVKIAIAQQLPNDPNLANAGEDAYNAASQELTDAQTAYNDLLNSDEAQNVLKARAQVAIAQETYYTALDNLRSLQIGDQSPTVMAAQQVVDQAKAALAQSQKGVEQAQANLDLLNAQVSKLTITAPSDGVVLTRAVEPGEAVNPGAEVLVLGQLSNLTMTVYVPEDRIGQVYLGQMANVKFDSFPNQTFQAKVTYISDQAEFTPRNVQTVEGRQTTVFAVKLQLQDTSGKLKPGMPGDVTFVLSK